jgi:hypothetical protein
VALVLSHGSLTFFFTAQPDAAVALALAAAFVPLLPSPSHLRQLVVAGLVVGLGAMVKPLYIGFLALPLMVAAGTHGDLRSSVARRIALVLITAALPIVVVLAWFAARGALNDLFEVVVRYNALEYSGVTNLAARTRLFGLAEYFSSGVRAPAAAFLVFGGVTLWRRSQFLGAFIVGWFLIGVALVVLQSKFFVYHWTVIVPPAILLVGVGLDALVHPREVPATSRSAFAILGYAAAATMMTLLAVQPARDIGNWVRLMAGLQTRAEYYAHFRQGSFSAADQVEAAAYIRSHTTDADQIAMLGYDTPAIYLSGRTDATRFGYALPLVGWRSTTVVRNHYRREFLGRLETPPAYIIVGLLFLGKRETLASFPEFVDYLNERYVLDRSFGEIDVYRRLY